MKRSQTTRGPTVETHYQQAKHELSALLERLGRAGEPRLPAEDQLSEDLGFSRPTIRSALLALQKEGKVQRLHGVGTFINRHALDITANIAEDRPFVELLDRLGYEPSVDIASVEERPLPAAMAERLQVPVGAPACVITRLFRASGEPAALSHDYVPCALLTAAEQITPERSTFAFLRRCADRHIRYSVARILPANPGPPSTTLLALPADAALLLLDHLHIDTLDRPTAVTHAYVNDAYISFSVIRAGTDL